MKNLLKKTLTVVLAVSMLFAIGTNGVMAADSGNTIAKADETCGDIVERLNEEYGSDVTISLPSSRGPMRSADNQGIACDTVPEDPEGFEEEIRKFIEESAELSREAEQKWAAAVAESDSQIVENDSLPRDVRAYGARTYWKNFDYGTADITAESNGKTWSNFQSCWGETNYDLYYSTGKAWETSSASGKFLDASRTIAVSLTGKRGLRNSQTGLIAWTSGTAYVEFYAVNY